MLKFKLFPCKWTVENNIKVTNFGIGLNLLPTTKLSIYLLHKSTGKIE